VYRRQVALLDRLVADMRLNSRFPISRSNLIQAIIDAYVMSDVDLSDACSEHEIVETMRDIRNGKRKAAG
jgi:hypothetical protein